LLTQTKTYLHFFAFVAGRFERDVDGLLEVVQIDVAIGIVQQPAQFRLELIKVGPTERVRVPAARHEPVKFRPAVIRTFQAMAVFDSSHHFTGFHAGIRCGTCPITKLKIEIDSTYAKTRK